MNEKTPQPNTLPLPIVCRIACRQASYKGASIYCNMNAAFHGESKACAGVCFRPIWFGMVNRGVLPQPYGFDEQWTISVPHTDTDIEQHREAFEDLAPALAKAQRERGAELVGAAH